MALLKLKLTKLHGLSPRANYTDRATAACQRSDYQLLGREGCHVVSVTDPYGRILGFLDRSSYFSIKYLLSCTHEAEWTPFQTHYFFLSGSAGNRTRASESVERTLTTRPQRRSTFVYITYINSVRTSQQTQYISVVYPGTLTTRPQRRSMALLVSHIMHSRMIGRFNE
jgi:hypothetical protein